MKHTGITQVGIGSSEAPDSTLNLPQSLYPLGMSHVGVFTGLLGYNRGFQCKAKVRGIHKGFYALRGIPSYLRVKVFQVHSSVYTDVTNQRIKVSAVCVAYKVFRYKTMASLQSKASKNYKVISNAIFKVKDRMAVTGVIKGLNDILYRTSGVIKSIGKLRYKAKGNLVPVKVLRYTVTANAKAWKSLVYGVRGLPSDGAKIVYAVSSSVQRKLRQGYKTTGNLLNTIGQWFYKVTAKTSIASFVVSVPKRVQEFVTNKRWFR